MFACCLPPVGSDCNVCTSLRAACRTSSTLRSSMLRCCKASSMRRVRRCVCRCRLRGHTPCGMQGDIVERTPRAMRRMPCHVACGTLPCHVPGSMRRRMQGLEIAQRLRDEMRDLQATTRPPPGPNTRAHTRRSAPRLASRCTGCTACHAVRCVAVGGDCEQTARSYAGGGVHVGRQPS